MNYKRIVTAISAGLQKQHATGQADTDFIAAEIIGQYQRMPDYLRLPISILTYLFDWFGLLSGGCRFQNKSTAAQQAQLASWKHSRVGVCRNFVRFYESLFLLIVLQETRS